MGELGNDRRLFPTLEHAELHVFVFLHVRILRYWDVDFNRAGRVDTQEVSRLVFPNRTVVSKKLPIRAEAIMPMAACILVGRRESRWNFIGIGKRDRANEENPVAGPQHILHPRQNRI